MSHQQPTYKLSIKSDFIAELAKRFGCEPADLLVLAKNALRVSLSTSKLADVLNQVVNRAIKVWPELKLIEDHLSLIEESLVNMMAAEDGERRLRASQPKLFARLQAKATKESLCFLAGEYVGLVETLDATRSFNSLYLVLRHLDVRLTNLLAVKDALSLKLICEFVRACSHCGDVQDVSTDAVALPRVHALPDGLFKKTMIRLFRERTYELQARFAGAVSFRFSAAMTREYQDVYRRWYATEMDVEKFLWDVRSLFSTPAAVERFVFDVRDITQSDERPRLRLEKLIELLQQTGQPCFQELGETVNCDWQEFYQLPLSHMVLTTIKDVCDHDFGLTACLFNIKKSHLGHETMMKFPQVFNVGAVPYLHLPREVSFRPLEPKDYRWLQHSQKLELTATLLADEVTRPVTLLRAYGQRFYLSDTIQSKDGRLFVFALVMRDNVLGAMIFYNSQSGGSWRACPYLEGTILAKLENYTQSTQPADGILQYLRTMEGFPKGVPTIDHFLEVFNVWRLDMPKEDQAWLYESAKEQVFRHPALARVFQYQPGLMFNRNNEADPPSLAALIAICRQLPAGFVPHFHDAAAVDSVVKYSHSILEECLSIRFHARLDDEPIWWEVGVARDGGAWVERIYFQDDAAGDTGRYSRVLDSGFLTSKPFEYVDQLKRAYNVPDIAPLIGKTTLHARAYYADFRAVLGELPFMKRFYSSPVYQALKHLFIGKDPETEYRTQALPPE